VKRIKDIQSEESKEREVDDGWVETDSPMVNAGAGKQEEDVAMDIDDLDMQNVGGDNQDQEAVNLHITKL